MADPRATPAMTQYYAFKKRHPGCVLFFRIGDFYEMFDEDAVTVSRAIGLTLTQRTEGVPMAGLPHHQLEVYLKRMVAQGFRVAVCEQLIEASVFQASGAKGVVPRAVTRVITPGTLVDEALLDAGATANGLGDASADVSALAAAVFDSDDDNALVSLAVVEASTGLFLLMDCPANRVADELVRRGVRELLFAEVNGGEAPPRVKRVISGLSVSATPRPPWHFRDGEAREAVLKHYGVSTLAGFGLSDTDRAVTAAGVVIRYLQETQSIAEEDAQAAMKQVAGKVAGFTVARGTLAHLRPPTRVMIDRYCVLDAVSVRSLEIERTLRPVMTADGRGGDASLLGVFLGGNGGKSTARTSMGKRLLREWLCLPLRDRGEIERRQAGVSTLHSDRRLSEELAGVLAKVQDVARIRGRIALLRATPRDLVAIASSIASTKRLVELTANAPGLADVHGPLARIEPVLSPLSQHVLGMCVESPPAHLREGGLIRDGVDSQLDEARLLQRDSSEWLTKYQSELNKKFNLPGLKVGYNRVFGYFIELPAGQAKNAPPELLRKQTLRNAERYTTPELRDFEQRVTTAESRALERERELFAHLCTTLQNAGEAISAFGDLVAYLDAINAFAIKAADRGWCKPTIVEEPVLQVRSGRHPVLDESLAGDFVPNDVELGAIAESRAGLALITGPNMAGKSTYIRQTALIALLALTGSFVPAESATVGIIDRIFTRIGADDALHAGQSTFMVEMIETANILNHATERSLVVLDEVGRGTSTLDGLSLAWGIVEHLAEVGPRTLFATHYHELTDLEDRSEGKIKNLHVAVREWPQGDGHAEIVFLHRIVPGRADQSYGLHVAKLAGIPATVVERGREVLRSLAVHQHGVAASGVSPATDAVPPVEAGKRGKKKQSTDVSGQFGLFTEFLQHPAVDRLKEVKIDALSPLQAFDVLRQLKTLTEEPGQK